ncbi:MAG: hypothetical protein HRT35_35120 [Algicola sp.]|nr:hypothetical protein [Algicola sp.]
MKTFTTILMTLLLFLTTITVLADEQPKDKKPDPTLAFLAGDWVGHGQGEGNQFKEVSTFSWDENRTYLNIDMAFFWGEKQKGGADGYFAIDATSNKLFFNIVMSTGAIIMQQQIERTDDVITLHVRAMNSPVFPAQFRVKLLFKGDNEFHSQVWMEKEGHWVQTMENHFNRVTDNNMDRNAKKDNKCAGDLM